MPLRISRNGKKMYFIGMNEIICAVLATKRKGIGIVLWEHSYFNRK